MAIAVITWKQLPLDFLEVERMFVVDVGQTRAAGCLVSDEGIAVGG